MKNKIKIWGLLTKDYYLDLKDCPPHQSEITLELKDFEKVVKGMLDKIGIKFTPCKKCGKPIFFLPTKSGRQMPVTCGLISHFADCKFANEFRRKVK